MKEAIISRPPEPLGQGMLQDQGDKILTPLAAGLHLTGFTVTVLEGHMGTVILQQIAITDDTPIEVAR